MRRLVLAMALLALAACDGGPSGPGALDAVVEGPAPLGAVVLEVTGASVVGFVGHGDTRAFGSEVSAAENRHRVALVDGSGGVIEFAIEVLDLAADAPSVSVLFAAGADNGSLGTDGIKVRVRK